MGCVCCLGTMGDEQRYPDLIDGRQPLNARYRRAVKARGHFPIAQAALKCLYLVTRSLDGGVSASSSSKIEVGQNRAVRVVEARCGHEAPKLGPGQA